MELCKMCCDRFAPRFMHKRIGGSALKKKYFSVYNPGYRNNCITFS